MTPRYRLQRTDPSLKRWKATKLLGNTIAERDAMVEEAKELSTGHTKFRVWDYQTKSVVTEAKELS